MMNQKMDRWWRWSAAVLVMALCFTGCAKEDKAKKVSTAGGSRRRSLRPSLRPNLRPNLPPSLRPTRWS